jgi:hypothetical protein
LWKAAKIGADLSCRRLRISSADLPRLVPIATFYVVLLGVAAKAAAQSDRPSGRAEIYPLRFDAWECGHLGPDAALSVSAMLKV